MLKKIVIIGPESTGKSSLCQQLAAHYNTLWCPEYAREYLLKHGMNYSYDDLLTIAKGQIELEEKCIQSIVGSQESIITVPSSRSQLSRHSKRSEGHPSPRAKRRAPLLFIDTDMYVMKVWCEFVFGKCHRFILDQIIKRKYDLYLLCDVDLPWVRDELREYPDHKRRQQLHNIYKNIMINQPVSWVEISGSNGSRLKKAIAAVDSLLNKGDVKIN